MAEVPVWKQDTEFIGEIIRHQSMGPYDSTCTQPIPLQLSRQNHDFALSYRAAAKELAVVYHGWLIKEEVHYEALRERKERIQDKYSVPDGVYETLKKCVRRDIQDLLTLERVGTVEVFAQQTSVISETIE